MCRIDLILAEPAGPFVKKIRAGFILLQAGMGLGLIRDCIAIMNEVDAPLGHVNRYLPQQPVDFRELLSDLESETMALARDPFNADDSYWRRVVALRLQIGDASVAAAHAAMLHCGARGYLKSHRVQRRLREAYFVAIVTPGHQAASQDAGGHVSFQRGFRIDPNFQPQNRRGLP